MQLLLDLKTPVFYNKDQLYLFGKRVHPKERERAIKDAQDEAQDLQESDDFKNPDK